MIETIPPDRVPDVPIPPRDPLAAVLAARAAPVMVAGLDLESPALSALREADVVVVVPLVADGRLLGTLNLGRRRSGQDYSREDRALLATIASQLAPAVLLAGLAGRQEREAAERERMATELRVARDIQQTLLPRNLPEIPGWRLDAFYRPAREVGGDFYDVVPLDGGRAVVVEGDVTDKGVPAALVMATCRAALRAAVEHSDDPGEILRLTNDTLVGDIPPTMFVTCFCAVVDGDGVRFANAGHPLPVLAAAGSASPVRATGMPLGLLPGTTYDVVHVIVPPGGMLVVASDGVAEARGRDGALYGFGRVAKVVAGAADPIAALVEEVDEFSPEQGDDMTIVVLARAPGGPCVLLDLRLPSRPGVERDASVRVAAAAVAAGVSEPAARRLGSAVAEAVMNAAEHGNGFEESRSVGLRLSDAGDDVVVEIADDGHVIDLSDIEVPDIEAKVAGTQQPRGWGRFLISQLVDAMEDAEVDGRHVLVLRMRKEVP